MDEALRLMLREVLADLLEKQAPRIAEQVAERLGRTMAPDVYLSPEQAGRVAGVTSDTICRWVKCGRLKRYSAGREVRVKASELEAMLAHRDLDEPTDADLDEKALSILSRMNGR